MPAETLEPAHVIPPAPVQTCARCGEHGHNRRTCPSIGDVSPPRAAFAGAWPAVPKSVAIARHAVAAYLRDAGTGEPKVQDIVLAVSECVTNVVYHAYIGQRLGEVRVRVGLTPEHIELTVEDDGRGMVPRTDSPGLGLGLPMVATMAESFETTATLGEGTRVTIRFRRRAD